MATHPHEVRTARLRVVASRPAPRTFGEGLQVGLADGYEQGRRDRRLEMAICGFLVGVLVTAALVVVLR